MYATGEHFNLPGHTYQNMKFTIVEKVKKQDIIYRQEREKYFIRKFNTFNEGQMKLAKIVANKHVLKKRVLLLLLNNVYLADKEYTFKIFHLLFFIFSKVDDNMYIKWI